MYGKAGMDDEGRRSTSIREGFGIASCDGIFQNVKTNIANSRLLAGTGGGEVISLDYDSQGFTLASAMP